MSVETTPPRAPARLCEERSALGQALASTVRATAAAHPAAQARVWKQLSRPANRWHAKYLAPGAAAALAAIAAVIFASAQPAMRAPRWQLDESAGSVQLSLEDGAAKASLASGASLPANGVLQVGDESAAVISLGGTRVALAPGSRLRLAAGAEPVLEEGVAAVRILGEHHLRIAAGAYTLDADGAPGGGAIFFAEVSAARVQIRSQSAAVRVSGSAGSAAIAAGAEWDSSAAATPGAGSTQGAHSKAGRLDSASLQPLGELTSAGPRAATLETLRQVALYRPAQAVPTDPNDLHTGPNDSAAASLLARAHQAESGKQYAEAASLYAQLARQPGPGAPAALYELARLRLRFLGQPQGALDALDEARARFPESPLAQEVALSAVDARLALGNDAATVREMSAFLDRFSSSERASEVRWLRASLELRANGCDAASSDLSALASDAVYGGDALLGQALCARRSGDEATAREKLREQVRRFPQSARHGEAVAALAGGPLAPP